MLVRHKAATNLRLEVSSKLSLLFRPLDSVQESFISCDNNDTKVELQPRHYKSLLSNM